MDKAPCWFTLRTDGYRTHSNDGWNVPDGELVIQGFVYVPDLGTVTERLPKAERLWATSTFIILLQPKHTSKRFMKCIITYLYKTAITCKTNKKAA